MDKAFTAIMALTVLTVLALGLKGLNDLNDGRVLTVVKQLTTPQVSRALASAPLKRSH